MSRDEQLKILNEKLDYISTYKDNWDDEGCYPVDPKTIEICRNLLEILTYLPLDIHVTNTAELYLEYEHFETSKIGEKMQSAKFTICLYDTTLDIYNKPKNAKISEVSVIPFCVLHNSGSISVGNSDTSQGYLKILNYLISIMVKSISSTESDRFRDAEDLKAVNFLAVKRTTNRTKLMQFQLDSVDGKYNSIERERPCNSYMDTRYVLIKEMISLLAESEYEINILYGQEMGIILSCGMAVYMMFDNDITLYQLVNNFVEEKVSDLTATELADLFLNTIKKNL